MAFFEKVYRLAHGTQLHLLNYLNQFGDLGVPIDQARTFYQTYLQRGQVLNVPGLQDEGKYFEFLLGANLFRRTETGYAITPLGHAFIQWMVSEGAYHDKLL